MSKIRPGETTLPFDPTDRVDAGVAFIGRISSPWGPDDCPKNIGLARKTGQSAVIKLDAAYVPGLAGLDVGQAVIVTYWMHESRRDIIVQKPRHASGPRGTFAIRSPARPNPIAMSTVRITAIEGTNLHIDAIDCFDGTPVVDIRPWLETVDVPPKI